MSTSLHDFASAAAVAAGAYPQTLTEPANGPTIDLGSGDGPCLAVQQVGAVAGGTTLEGWIEQSANGTAWAAVTDAEFTPVTDGDDVQVIRFDRTARYVRWACDVSGGAPSAAVAVLIGQQKKTF